MNLPVWPSGQRTRPQCAVTRSVAEVRASAQVRLSTAYQRIISNNSYAHDKQGLLIPGR